jgi:RNA polymerase sigma-70 factor (ECF subfamily)
MSDASARDRDRNCLRRLAEGDVGALESIWEAHGDRAFRHALWITGRREDAEDVVQSVFVRLAGRGAELLGVRELTSYLGAMVHREAIAVSKRRAAGGGSLPLDAEAPVSPLDDLGAGEDRRRILALVATLPVEQREVVVLHVWNELTFREIGRVTGVSTFTAASRYRLATAHIRRAIGRGTR